MKGSKRLRGRPVWRAPVPFSIHARHCRGDRKSEVLPGDPAVSLEPELCCIADAVDSFSFHVLIGCNLFWSERATTVGGLQSGISVTEALRKAENRQIPALIGLGTRRRAHDGAERRNLSICNYSDISLYRQKWRENGAPKGDCNGALLAAWP